METSPQTLEYRYFLTCIEYKSIRYWNCQTRTKTAIRKN